MLSEGFLSVLGYKEDWGSSSPKTDQACGLPPEVGRSSVVLKLQKGKEEWPAQLLGTGVESPTPDAASQPGQARSIPGIKSPLYCGLELYRSWHCFSFCKDYPDLQLHGDHLGDKASESPAAGYRSYEGPLLQSRDLTELDHLRLESMVPETQRCMELHVDDATETSINLHGEPPSNSVLNGYLESKVLEVYRQYMEDSLARCDSSPGCMLPPSLAAPNLPPLSLALPSLLPSNPQLSAEPAAPPGLLSSQRSSDFSSPVLRISNTELGEQCPVGSQPPVKPQPL